MSSLELEELRARPRSRERAVLFAQLAAEAAERGDWELAIQARFEEVRDATFEDLDEHAVVAGTELLGYVEALRESGERLGLTLGRSVVWGLKYTSGASLRIPEVPLAAVDRLHEAVDDVLRQLGLPHYCTWQLELSRFDTAGDLEQVAERVRWVLPHVSRRNTYRYFMDCVGCSLVQMADALGEGASPEEIEAVLRTPIADVRDGVRHEGRTAELSFGADWGCEVAQYWSHEVYATALARAGRAVEACTHAELSLRYQRAGGYHTSIGPTVARLEAARAAGERESLREWTRALGGKVQSPRNAYARHEALLALVRAARALGDEVEEREGWVRDCLELGRRLDARIEKPRHEALARAAAEG